jgi:hypothetical protein
MNKTRIVIATAVAATAVLVGCASRMGGAAADADQVAADMVKAGFRSQGIATVDRVTGIDETLKLCNAADVAGKPLAAEVAKRIEAENLKTVKWPSDGKFLGDWKEGEKIAQSGRGQTWTDAANTVNGEPVPLRQAAWRDRPRQRGGQAHRGIHLGQDLERQGLQRLLQHAAFGPHGQPDRRPGPRHHGAAARPRVTGQQVMHRPGDPRPFFTSNL